MKQKTIDFIQKNSPYLKLAILILFLNLLRLFPAVVEVYYSNFLYQKIYHFISLFTSRFSFSLGDVMYFFWGFGLLIFFFKMIFTNKVSFKELPKKIASKLWKFILVFHFIWGFNYYRTPLSDKLDLSKDYNLKELQNFTEILIKKSNETHLLLTKDANICYQNNHNETFWIDNAINDYRNATLKNHFIDIPIKNTKKSLYSTALTYMGFSGYINPFTLESQINTLPPNNHRAFTVTHEMAHQLGYGNESECNFIAFIVCHQSKEVISKYAAYTVALRYCLSQWKEIEPTNYKQYLVKLNPGIIKDFEKNSEFWKKYQTNIENGFHFIYDWYLKMNQQEEGIQTYSRFVQLLIKYYKNDNDFWEKN